MSDIIKLLPDSVANQIAAGEVVQRPASIVKELLENSVDAKATEIILLIKDAGKTLIQVADNGIGMSPTDARLSFERHATSKIQKADDLFSLFTKGFRGEALASIAAVASVELNTKQREVELGTQIIIEGSQVKKQESVTCQNGTVFFIKNLFYNIPARRNFLKSDNVEYNHVIEEFTRVALAHPDIVFKFYNNDHLIYHLFKGNLKQRIVGLFGNNFDEKIVPVEEETNLLKIKGFIGKPEFARKTRGEQYFFVNDRFIKSPYLNHAIQEAFNQVLPSEAYPSYFIFLEVPPARIDINIHPTKTEIKFEDEKVIYTIIKSAVKRSIGQYNIAPSLDFDAENNFAIDFSQTSIEIKQPKINFNPDYNPFKASSPSHTANNATSFSKHRDVNQWESLYKVVEKNAKEELSNNTGINTDLINFTSNANEEFSNVTDFIQLYKKHILFEYNAELWLVDQHLAHERVLFEQLNESLKNHNISIQKLLFPQTIQLSLQDYNIVINSMEALKEVGFEINDNGNNTISLTGTPSFVDVEKSTSLFETIIDSYKNNTSNSKEKQLQNIALSVAQSMAIKHGRQLQTEEIKALVENLFKCKIHTTSLNGEPIYKKIKLQDLETLFNK